MNSSKVREDFFETFGIVGGSGRRGYSSSTGEDVAAVVPIEDLRLLEALEGRMDLDDARTALAETKKKGAKPFGHHGRIGLIRLPVACSVQDCIRR